jgi:hypothetical protein
MAGTVAITTTLQMALITVFLPEVAINPPVAAVNKILFSRPGGHWMIINGLITLVAVKAA